jgi:hypothetical protein
MIYVHGGFENETPNVPTNSIVKLDLYAILKTNASLVQKLEQFIGSNGASGTGANPSKQRSGTPSSDSNR